MPITESQKQVDNSDDSDDSDDDTDDVDDVDATFDSLKSSVAGNSSDSSDGSDDSDDTDTVTIYTLEGSYDNYQQILEFNSDFSSSIALDGVDTFYGEQDKDSLESFLSTLYSASGFIYICDYLGAPTGATDEDKNTDYMNKWQTLTQVLEAQITENQNPASVYVG